MAASLTALPDIVAKYEAELLDRVDRRAARVATRCAAT